MAIFIVMLIADSKRCSQVAGFQLPDGAFVEAKSKLVQIGSKHYAIVSFSRVTRQSASQQ
jgi:hypothetical protein